MLSESRQAMTLLVCFADAAAVGHVSRYPIHPIVHT